MWTLEESLARLDRILSKPVKIPFEEKERRFNESVRMQEHGTLGMKWGVTHEKLKKGRVHFSTLEHGGYFQKGTKREKVYQALLDAKGDWVKMQDLRPLAPGSLASTIRLLKQFGEKKGKWTVETQGAENAGGKVRLVMKALGDNKEQPKQKEKDENQSETESSLSSKSIKSQERLGGGVSVTKVVTFDDGSKAVFKPHDGEPKYELRDNISRGYQTEREVGAWRVAKIVGMDDLVTPCVERTVNGKRGVLMDFKNGELADNMWKGKFDGDKDLCRAAAFDYVIGNTDRHARNWLVEGSKLQLIDHGLAFPDKGAYKVRKNADFIKEAANKFNRDEGKRPQDFVEPYEKNKDKIVGALEKAGLPKGAIDGVKNRIDNLGKAESWYDL